MPMDAVLLAVAVAVATGAVIAGAVALRASRRDRSDDDAGVRRAPSPSSVGLDEDPIVAALRAGEHRTARRIEPTDPPG